jgi:hypothetical protein
MSTGSFSDAPVDLPKQPKAPAPAPSKPVPAPAQPVSAPGAAPPLKGSVDRTLAASPSWSENKDTRGEVERSSQTKAKKYSAPQVEGQATVRYYSVMNPEKLFPLMVVFTEKQIREIVETSVKQAVSQKLNVEEGSTLELEPILPGCEVYPPLARITINTDTKSNWSSAPDEGSIAPAKFYVLPKVMGRVESARVVIRQNGEELAEVPLDIVVRRQRLAVLVGLFGLISPYLMMGLKALKLDPTSQSQMGYSLYYQAGEWVTSTIQPEWVVVGCLIVALLLFLWCRPRSKSSFWEVKTQ